MGVISQQIVEDIESLPEQFQIEALDFVQFLKMKMSKEKGTSRVGEPNGIDILTHLKEGDS